MWQLFANRIEELARIQPMRPALLEEGGIVNYAQLWRNVLSVLAQMEEAGVKGGDAVILAAANDFSFVYAYLAAHALGAVAVPLDPRIPAERFEYIKNTVKPTLILWAQALMPQSRGFFLPDAQFTQKEPAMPDAESLADIMFTSGTTGDPKGVALTHANIAASINNINSYIGNGPEDVEICTMPFSHSFGLGRLRCALYAGGSIGLCDSVAQPKKLFEAIKKHKATGIGFVGPAWRMLRKLSGDRISQFRSQLSYLELGSAPLTAQEKAHLASLLPDTRLCMHYGLTEASRAAFLDFHAENDRLETIGKASPLCEIAILDSSGRQCPIGEMGEICVAGPMVSKGYINRDNAAYYTASGYFRTGDLGSMDASGFITFYGRLTEMINVGGEKVGPMEIESALTSLPAIREAACVGMPDPVLGEKVAAFVICEPGQALPDIASLRELLADRLEHYKIPARLIAVDELPRTPSGKLRRAALREWL